MNRKEKLYRCEEEEDEMKLETDNTTSQATFLQFIELRKSFVKGEKSMCRTESIRLPTSRR